MGINNLFGGYNVNLKVEMDSFIFGSEFEAPKGRPVIYRRMKKDANGDLIRCDCVTLRTDEPDKDTYCPNCLGSKYYWEETFIKSYWMPEGDQVGGNMIFFFDSTIAPSSIDELITVELDGVGGIASPVTRVKLYNVLSAYGYREDNGLLAYWEVKASPENRRYLGAN